jgi:hypothetical protein
MQHITKEYFDIPSAWRGIVSLILHEGEYFPVKVGSQCTMTKKLSGTFIINNPSTRPLVDSKCLSTDDISVGKYALEYLWIDNKTPEQEYTYGSRLRSPVDQIQKAIELLSEEPYNRQITLTIRIPSDINAKHPPCLTMIDLEVIDRKLNLYAYFRSWDGFKGFPDNVAGLLLFLEAIIQSVNDILISEGEEDRDLLSVGKLILMSKNIHLYQEDWEKAENLEKSNSDNLRMKI